MRVFYPDVARAILSGEPTEPPPNRRLLIAATPDLRIWIVRKRGDVTLGVRPVPASVPHVAISSPPFVVVLADERYDGSANYFDTSEWLRERAGERRRLVIRMPVVASYSEDEPPEDLPAE
jgi:hypothetical protein